MAYIQLSPRRALRAASTLAKDPDDLPQVFTIIESLSLNTLERLARRMSASAGGRRLLQARPDIVPTLADRAALARLPEGSLGRAYLAFVEAEGITAEGIREADAMGTTKEDPMPAPLDYVNQRMRDTHDLWHAATGYSGDVVGETALLAFSFAQTKNPAIGLIILIGLLKTLKVPSVGTPARHTIVDGFRRGRRAAWLPAQDWESMLALPVDVVRRRLSLEDAPDYTRVRSAELRAIEAAAAA